jgi:hypothetical protein
MKIAGARAHFSGAGRPSAAGVLFAQCITRKQRGHAGERGNRLRALTKNYEPSDAGT